MPKTCVFLPWIGFSYIISISVSGVTRQNETGGQGRMLLLVVLSLSLWAPLQAAEKDVHAFYYLWYGNPETDGQFRHWDHEVLPHWTPAVNRQHREVGLYYDPTHDNLHSPFYPLLGAYSSMDPSVIRQHFRDLQRAKVGVISVSWWGQAHKQESTDNQGVSTDLTVALLLKLADETHTQTLDSETATPISVCFHMEPYPGRSARSTLEDLQYIHEKYGHHPSLARRKDDGRVIFYIYDSYHISAADWADIFTISGTNSIRRGKTGGAGSISSSDKDSSSRSGGSDGPFAHLDSFVLGLWLDASHGHDLATAGFDGFYTYFAADGFSYGSTSRNWPRMCSFARSAGMVCTLSVGPGYQDDKIRPWNGHNTRARQDGGYYDEMWRRAVQAGAEIVSVTSFNEWGEGTQIEPVDQTPPPVEAQRNTRTPVEITTTATAEDSPSFSSSSDFSTSSNGLVQKPVPRDYLTYGSLGSYGYIDRTAHWAKVLHSADSDSA